MDIDMSSAEGNLGTMVLLNTDMPKVDGIVGQRGC